MPLIQFSDVSIHFGHAPLLDKVNFTLDKGEHVGLIGRNGEGKSTLLKLINQELSPDSGTIKKDQGLNIARLEQEVPQHEKGTIFEVVASALGEKGQIISDYQHLIEKKTLNDEENEQLSLLQQKLDNLHAWDKIPLILQTLTKMSLNPNTLMSELSGGLKRRVLLAKCLLTEPDLLLLDEPTNHLDIEAIFWLENFLKSYNGAFILVSHDRTFLKNVTKRILDIDRGNIHSFSCDYESYLARKEAILSAEEKANANFDKKLAKEEVWIRQGIKARRTRNEGRVRKLKALREERATRINQKGQMQLDAKSIDSSGKMVFEAKNVNFSYDDKTIVKDFSTLVAKGDKIGLIGPNGSGKTTLLKLLLQELTPISGSIKKGTNLKIAYFDQMNQSFDEEKSAIDNVGQGAQTIDFFGEEKHVIGYLQQFLFSPERARTPVKYFSGGEKNRLFLAKLFTKGANLLVLDEPTNDLDIESLEVLESFLMDYPATLIIVSHDRSFLDNIATTTWGYVEGETFKEFLGGYSDYQKVLSDKSQKATTKAPSKEKKANTLSREQQKKLNKVTRQIETLEKDIEKVQVLLANPDLYLEENQKEYQKHVTNLKSLEEKLETAFIEWESLEN